jgi:hypothetical protein
VAAYGCPVHILFRHVNLPEEISIPPLIRLFAARSIIAAEGLAGVIVLPRNGRKIGWRSAGTLSITGRHLVTWTSPSAPGYAVLDGRI